jgi:hypothetical protein
MMDLTWVGPLAPKFGGTGVDGWVDLAQFKVPLLKGDLGGSSAGAIASKYSEITSLKL